MVLVVVEGMGMMIVLQRSLVSDRMGVVLTGMKKGSFKMNWVCVC